VRHICWRFYDTTTVHKFQQFFRKGVEICMLAQWTADLVGKLHKHRITQKQLAEELGVTREYVSMVLNGHRCPDGAERTFTDALDRLISRVESADSM
jgi:predicted XRE-type DNA-binding protein